MRKIQFIDLKTQQQKVLSAIELAIQRVHEHGMYILGPEVEMLEKELAKFCNVKHAIVCSNGTDALALGLRVKNVKPGHAIFVPSFTFAATAEVVDWMGATPIFIDSLPDTYNMDPKSLENGIQTAIKLGLKPCGIIPVDLFGQPADYDSIQSIANQYQLWVMADAAQSYGATYKKQDVGSIGDIATTSFFPAKPLGCYGDGGAIFTNDDTFAKIIKSIRVHGQGEDKYDNVRIGMNGRLDTIQAAVLLEKLKIFPEEIIKRNEIAKFYTEGLKNVVQTPHVMNDTTSVWAQYTICLPKHINRASFMEDLKNLDIPTVIYYVKPLHQQKAYSHYPTASQKNLPVCEHLSERVVSLPMNPYLDKEQLTYIVDSIENLVNHSIKIPVLNLQN